MNNDDILNALAMCFHSNCLHSIQEENMETGRLRSSLTFFGNKVNITDIVPPLSVYSIDDLKNEFLRRGHTIKVDDEIISPKPKIGKNRFEVLEWE